jgi:protein SERAC1
MIYAYEHRTNQRNEDFINAIIGALFFGVPSEGMDTASLHPIVVDQPNTALVTSLQAGSELLTRQSQNFSRYFNNYLDPPIAFFYENRNSKTARKVSQRFQGFILKYELTNTGW